MKEKLKTHKLIGIEISNSEKLVSVGKLKQKGLAHDAYWSMGYGRQIKISHCGGYESTYAHLYKLFVKRKDSLVLGQPIGRAGNSGVVTGPHLHYEVLRNGEKTDPIPYIKKLEKVGLGH